MGPPDRSRAGRAAFLWRPGGNPEPGFFPLPEATNARLMDHEPGPGEDALPPEDFILARQVESLKSAS